MLCQRCGQNPAEVLLKKIVNGHKEEIQLCAECAKGEAGGFGWHLDPSLAFQNLLTSLIDKENYYSPVVKEGYQQGVQCPKCGLTYGGFRKEGRFGCSECYQTFKPFLSSFLQRIHGNDKHTGKIFGPAKQLAEGELEVLNWKKKLQQAIEEEKYEEAAILRDKVKELEKKAGLEGE